jgi:hypothetical protein
MALSAGKRAAISITKNHQRTTPATITATSLPDALPPPGGVPQDEANGDGQDQADAHCGKT